MPSVRLSSEAVKFLKQAKNQNNFQGFKPIVSVVRDDEESDFESESEEADAVVITPRLKAHTRRIYELKDDEVIPGDKVLQPPPVSNLSKRFSSSSLGTPSRILQLALEKKTSDEGDSHQKSDEELVVSNADMDSNTKHSKNQVEKHTTSGEPIKKGRAVRKRTTKEQQQVKVSVDDEAEFKVPQPSRRRKNTEQSEKQPKAAKRRGKNKQVEEEDALAQGTGPSDDSESQVANPPNRKLRRGKKALEDPKTDALPTISPSKLINVKVTIENVPSASPRRDVSLPANNFKNTSTIDDTIDSVIGNSAEINESPVVPAKDTRYARRRKDFQEITDDIRSFDDYVAEKNKSLDKGTKNSRRRKNAQEAAEESEDNAGFVTKRRRKAKEFGSSPTKRQARNRKTKKLLQKDEDPAISNGEPNNEDNAGSSTSNPAIPEFSSDHEEDRSTMSSPSRDSPIITKSNRLSKALVTKSPSNDESSESSPPIPRRRLSTIPSRSPSTSPDMFTPSPARAVRETRASSQKTKGAPKLSHPPENAATPLTRSKLRASLGASTPTASEAHPTQSSSDQTTPLQLEAVGLVRKPTPQSVPRTPPRQSILPSAITPLSSRNLTMPSEFRPANHEANQDMTNSLKRKQTPDTFVTTPKRQRVQNFSPKKTQKPENSDATPRTRQQAKDLSPKKLPEPSSIGTPKSLSAIQGTKNASPEKLQEPININTEETLPCMANIDQLEIEGLSVSAAHIAKSSGQQGSLARSEESAFEQTITRRTNISENVSLVPIPTMHPARFNAYLANPDDPVRATQLLATDEYRVSWLHLLPKCSFYFRVRSTTMIVVISGVILISGDCNQRGLVLNSKSRVAELNVGALCQAVNTGETLAIFQVTESLL